MTNAQHLSVEFTRLNPQQCTHERNVTGDNTVIDRYKRDGKFHREDGPARTSRYADGSILEQYYRDGQLHRDDGPAEISQHGNGSVSEYYYREGKQHRADGPALILRDKSGAISQFYYMNGLSYGSVAPTADVIRERELKETIRAQTIKEDKKSTRSATPKPPRWEIPQSRFIYAPV
jgi:hypothetical protein